MVSHSCGREIIAMTADDTMT